MTQGFQGTNQHVILYLELLYLSQGGLNPGGYAIQEYLPQYINMPKLGRVVLVALPQNVKLLGRERRSRVSEAGRRALPMRRLVSSLKRSKPDITRWLVLAGKLHGRCLRPALGGDKLGSRDLAWAEVICNGVGLGDASGGQQDYRLARLDDVYTIMPLRFTLERELMRR